MAATIKLDIVTPEAVTYSEEIESLEAPAIDGLIGILPRHAPLVTALDIGVLDITRQGEKLKIAISQGFMEVKPEQINVVVRTAELPEEINEARAEEAKDRAKNRLNSGDKEIDETRARAALERALARIHVADYHSR